MAVQKRIKTLSKLTSELLAEGESVRSDFKRRPDGITTEDLVSFANADSGGNILVGVDERVIDKTQVGVVCGCEVDDGTVLQILNKAVSCIPPVAIIVFVENLGDKPILRVEVPSSQTKPHCTPKGIYCRRDGSRNRPLHPSELLRIFLDSEASSFAARFEVAAKRITEEISDLESSLGSSIRSMSDQLGWADSQLGDTESLLERIQALAAKLVLETGKTNTRLRTLFRQDKRDDPVQKAARLRYVNELVNLIMEDQALFKGVIAGRQLSLTGKHDDESDITDEDAKNLLKIATKHVYETARDKTYQIVVKSPKDCTDEEIDKFSDKVSQGGEVIDGVRNRVIRAYKLGFIVHNRSVVGTAALKKPAVSYREKVFKKAASELDHTEYHYELGWIFLDVAHRKKGQMTRLINDLLPSADASALFATTRSSNEVMQEMLAQLNFSQDGVEYPSDQNPSDKLRLFVRSAK